MKLLLFMFSFAYLSLNAQSIVFSENTLIKSEDDKYVNLHTFDSIMGTNKFTMKLVTDNDKVFKHVQLLSKTEADYSLEKELKTLENRKISFKTKSFSVTDYDGNQINLNDYSQKVLFLHFWSVKNEDSNEKIEALNSLQKHFEKDKNVSFLSINFDSDLTKSQKEIINNKTNFPVIFDAKSSFDSYTLSSPKYVLINKKGSYSYISSGFKTVDFFIKMITSESQKN